VLGPGQGLALLTSVALLAVAWMHTFSQMWLRWFPAWQNPRYADDLGKRLTEGDSYYTHGPLVPLVSLAIAWFVYRRVGAPVSRTRTSSAAGWLLLLGGLLLHLVSVYARVTFVSGFALIAVLGGLVLVWGGWALARAYWLPIAFLAFMVPLPMSAIADLNLKLKFTAGESALWLTTHVFGIPAVMDGSYVYFASGPGEPPKFLVIEDVCSGLRSLISLICFASLFALICRAKGVWRLVMLAMAVPVAIGCNIARITILNLTAHYGSVEMAGPGSAIHDMSGLLVFALALATLFGLEQVIVRLGKWLKRDWIDLRLLGYLETIKAIPGQAMAMRRPAVIAMLALVAALSVMWSKQSVAEHRGSVAGKAVAPDVQISGDVYRGVDLELDDLTLDILETRDYLYRRFTQARTGKWIDFLIVFSADNRKGTHPPEVCLTGGGDQLVAKREHEMNLPDMGRVVMRELITQRGQAQTYHLYVYKCGDSYTPSFFVQQATIFMNGLLSRNAAGALIRLTCPVENQDVESARAFAVAAAHELMPQVDRGLP
jgi:EpsI family protein